MATTKEKRLQLMEYYSERGRKLKDVLHLIGIEWETALKWCREHNIYFPDHKRRRMKESADV